MRPLRLRRPSPAFVIALLALFVAVGGPAEAAKLINGQRIKRGTITAKQVKNRSLGVSDLSRGARTSLRATPSRSVGTSQLKEGSVGPVQLAPGSVTAAALTSNSVSGATIIDRQVGNADLADSSVTAGKIGTSAVRKSELAGSAVGTAELANGAVTGDKVTDGTLTGAKIADGSLAAADLAEASGTVALSFGSILAQKCEGTTLPAPGLAAGAVVGDDLVIVGAPASWPDDVVLTAQPAGDSTIRIIACNPTNGPVTTPATSARVLAIG